jgi:hypothetical protein
MKLLWTMAALLALAGCADINWQRTAKESVESACRGSSNCRIECDPRSAAAASEPRCMDASRRRL